MPLYWSLQTASQTTGLRWNISTATRSAANAWTDIYYGTQGSSTGSTWISSVVGNTSPTTASTTALTYTSVYSDTWALWEGDMDNTQYLQLARERVTISAERRVEIARMQEAARRQQQEQEDQWARIHAMQQRDIALARERSRELLLAHLTPRQRETFTNNGWFIVHGGRSDTKYRIRADRIAGNIEVFEGDRITHRLCGHLNHNIPQYDHILAQKVSLELDEEAFVRICNRHAA